MINTVINSSVEYKAIVIGGSAGSFHVLQDLLSKIPAEFAIPIIICCHRLKHIKNGFIEALSTKSIKQVKEPEDKEVIKRGMVYLAPANYHMNIEMGYTFSLSTEQMVNNSRPSIDITFETAAYTYKERLIGILLTGANKDGALGMKRIKERGGLTVVQDPMQCAMDTMPKAALQATAIDHVFGVLEIANLLNQINKRQS